MSTSIEKNFLNTLREHNLLAPGDHILLAVSGGADSVALLYLFHRLRKQLGVKISLAHFNHCLRGSASDRDEAFVRDLAGALGIPGYFGRGDVAGWARRHKTSLENAARQRRYEFLKQVAEKIKAVKTATAHHLDDQAETFFLRLLRGSGRTGQRGIHFQRADRIIRPMLNISRKQIEYFLNKNKIKFRTDASNRDSSFIRNRLRRRILPLLEKINPRLKETIGQNVKIWQEEEAWLEQLTRRVLDKIVSGSADNFQLDLKGFSGQSRPLQRRILKTILRKMAPPEKEISAGNIADLLELAAGSSGRQLYLPGPVYARRQEEFLVFSKRPPAAAARNFSYRIKIGEKIYIAETGQTVKMSPVRNPGLAVMKKNAPGTLFLDINKSGKNFRLRSRRPGDSFKPLGQQHHKKIKDILIDRHIAAAHKHLFPILTDRRGRPLAILNLAISEDVRVSPGSKMVWELAVT